MACVSVTSSSEVEVEVEEWPHAVSVATHAEDEAEDEQGRRRRITTEDIFSRVAIQSMQHKRVLELGTDLLPSPSVGRSVCMSVCLSVRMVYCGKRLIRSGCRLGW